MKTVSRLFSWLVFAVATQAMAALESLKFDPENVAPEFPLTLMHEGVTEGRVVLALSISADGALTDTLVLAYTHEAFVRECRTVLNDWKFIAARYDGKEVGVQIQLTFDFHRSGFVETSTTDITNHFLNGRFASRTAYRIPEPRELDRRPVPLATPEPVYPQQAEQKGVKGSVQIRFYIDETGKVRLPSVGPESHPYLAELAVEALRQWRFEPATRRGKPVLVAATQEFQFGINP